MPVELTVRGVTVGLAHPVALAGVPVAAAALWYLVVRRATAAVGRAHLALLAARVLVVACLLTAAATPYTVSARATRGDPQVRLLVDESASTAVTPNVTSDLEAALEDRGVTVVQSTIAAGNTSRVGDGVLANVRPNASLLVVSDGQVTGGASLAAAADVARRTNATINVVRLPTRTPEHYVTVAGPAKTSVGVTNRFVVRVAGTGGLPANATLRLHVDGTRVRQIPLDGHGAVTVTRNFSATGTHRVTARLAVDDRYDVNDVARTTVRVVEQPRVLYVSRGDYPLADYLRRLYDVTRAESVPGDLSPYYAVVVQDAPARSLGNVSALQRHVIGGNGLVVVGGPHAYANGNYRRSPLAAMLPVRPNESAGSRSRVVLAVDVSGSAAGGMRTQKALALDVLNQLSDRHAVGLVAFNSDAYRVADVAPLATSRATLERRIRRLTAGGGTRIGAGLAGAGRLLGSGGTVILLSDGRNGEGDPVAVARGLQRQGTDVITVGVGSVNADVMRDIADAGGGTFLLANETSRLRILFGGDRRYRGDGLTVVDDEHFVTAGVRLDASLPRDNKVSVKPGASYLVATGRGTPAVAAWRFGLGRVVSVTAYDARGGLNGLLTPPDARLVTKSVNWAIGDPDRKQTGVTALPDTRVGQPTRLVYTGATPPDAAVSFRRTGDRRYVATVTPATRGYHSVLGATYAANYRAEYAGFGQTDALERAAETTGGEVFRASEHAAIAQTVKRQLTRVRDVRRDWRWLALLVALAGYLADVAARRLRRRTGHPFTQ